MRVAFILMYLAVCTAQLELDPWDCSDAVKCAQSFSKTLVKERTKWFKISEILKIWPTADDPIKGKKIDLMEKPLSWFELELKEIREKQKILKAKLELELEMLEESRQKWEKTIFEKVQAKWEKTREDMEISFKSSKSKF